jgi:hypothetical protein
MGLVLESDDELGDSVDYIKKPNYMNSGIRSQKQGADQAQGDCEQCAKEGKARELGHGQARSQQRVSERSTEDIVRHENRVGQNKNGK